MRDEEQYLVMEGASTTAGQKRGRRAAAGIVSTQLVIGQGVKYTVLRGVNVRGMEIRA